MAGKHPEGKKETQRVINSLYSFNEKQIESWSGENSFQE